MRAFLALEIRAPEIIAKLTSLQRDLLATGADLKMVQPQNLHFTVKFFGEISEREVEVIMQSLNSLRIPSARVVLQGVGAFPSLSHIRVVWVGTDEASSRSLRAVAQEADRALRGKVYFDQKPFEPHLTVARVRSGAALDRLANVLTLHRSTFFGEDFLKALKLKKSVLTPQGPAYSDVRSLPLVD